MAATQNDFKVLTNLVVRGTATIATVDSFVTTGTSAPLALPSLNLNFVASNSLDPRISFVRASGATYVGKNGLIQYAGLNQPRLDFDPVNTGTNLGLFIEEQRTNIHLYSAQAGQSVNNGNCRFTTASVVAPDGSLADVVTNTPSVNSYFYNQSSSIMTPLSWYTRSVYAKTYGGSNTIIFENYINAGNSNVQFNLATGAISNNSTGTAYMVNAGNGWYRCIWTFQSSASASDYSKVTYIGGYGSTPLTTPIAVWGSQFEAGGFASSYIPTGASQSTRINDWAYINGQKFNSWFNQTSGTFYVDSDGTFSTSTYNYPRVLHVSDGSAQTNVLQYLYNLGPNNLSSLSFTDWVNANYIQGISSPSTLVSGTRYKSAFTYSPAQLTGYCAGSSFQTGTVTQLPTVTANQMGIGGYSFFTNNSQVNGHIKQVTYWPTVLPQQQLQSLTTATIFTTTNFVNTVLATNARKPDFQVDNGVLTSANLEVADVDQLYATTLNRPTQQPSLMLNFLKGTLDSRITFSRASGASVIGPNGLIQYVGNNVPRFDYSTTSTGTCLGLLIEEQRINYMLNTNAPGGGILVKNSGSATGPDGKLAHKFTVNATTVTNFPSVASGGTYSFTGATGTVVTVAFTGYFGPGFGSQILEPHIVIQFSVGGASAVYNEVQINTTNWTIRQNSFNTSITQVTAPTITPAPGGMYKVSYVVKYTDDGTLRNLMSTYLQIRDTSQSGIYATNGDSGVQYACMQTEVGAFPTSYIPTETVAVTRAVDLATMSGQNFMSWVNPTQGTLYLEADAISAVSEPASFRWPLSISQAYTQKIGFHKPGNSLYAKIADDAGVSRFEPLLGTITTNTTFNVALSYSSGNQKAVLNYVNSATGTATVLPKLIDNLRIGNGDYPWCGHIRRIVYYPEQLSSTQTVLLTVI